MTDMITPITSLYTCTCTVLVMGMYCVVANMYYYSIMRLHQDAIVEVLEHSYWTTVQPIDQPSTYVPTLAEVRPV